MELGFADYVDRIAKAGNDRLFPDWLASKRKGGGPNEYPSWSNSPLIRGFNRTVLPAALPDTLRANVRREVTFHGFRGAFKAMLLIKNRIQNHIVDEVLGHAHPDIDQRYVGLLSIEEIYPDVRSCRYDGLIIPRLDNI